MKDTVAILLTLSLFIGTLIYGGFWFGRQYEKKFWIKNYQENMEKTCLECAGITGHPGSYSGVVN